MKNNGYLYAKIGGISIILCMVCGFFWSKIEYRLPSPFGIITLLCAVSFIYFTIKGADLIAEMEKQKNKK